MRRTNILNIGQFRQQGHEDFHINTLENHLITRHKDIEAPHSHNFYLSVLFTRGSGQHEIDFTAYNVKPGALFFLNPGQTHHWELSEDAEGYILFHTRDFYESWFTATDLRQFPFFYSMSSNPVLYLTENDNKSTISRFREILSEFSADRPMQKQAIISLLSLLYLNATRLYGIGTNNEADNKNSYYQKFRQFEDLVERAFRTEKLPAYYAQNLAITLRHLNRITQTVAGKTAGSVIAGRIVLEAQKELVQHQGNFKNVADTLGYGDYAYFSRFFKSNTGLTPSEFTKKYIKA